MLVGEPTPQKRNGKRALLGDLAAQDHGDAASEEGLVEVIGPRGGAHWHQAKVGGASLRFGSVRFFARGAKREKWRAASPLGFVCFCVFFWGGTLVFSVFRVLCPSFVLFGRGSWFVMCRGGLWVFLVLCLYLGGAFRDGYDKACGIWRRNQVGKSLPVETGQQKAVEVVAYSNGPNPKSRNWGSASTDSGGPGL